MGIYFPVEFFQLNAMNPLTITIILNTTGIFMFLFCVLKVFKKSIAWKNGILIFLFGPIFVSTAHLIHPLNGGLLFGFLTLYFGYMFRIFIGYAFPKSDLDNWFFSMEKYFSNE